MIYIVGDIDNDAFLSFSRKLAKLEANGDQAEIIDVYLTSNGGDAEAALAFYDRIRGSSHKIRITAFGLVASAATLIFLAGHIRIMMPSAWFMVHEDSFKIKTSSVSEAEKILAHSRRLEDQWCRIFACRTELIMSGWVQLHKEETYLDAEECLHYGVAHRIVTHG